MENGIHNSFFLFIVINKFSLVRRSHVQRAAVSYDLPGCFVVFISIENITDGYFV